MPTVGNDTASVRKLLHQWDHGNKQVRARILEDFIMTNRNKTGPEIENEFAQSASLFLTRLTAWLRMTYMIGTHVSLQLKAIAIFVGASSGHKFLTEFLEVGGVLSVLEILGLKQAKEEDKVEALKLLMHIANSGRRYKELICESFGIRAVAECLAKSTSEETQDCAKTLIQELSNGNPKFEVQVYKALIALLRAASPKAQQMAAETLRIVQPVVKTTSPTIVDSVLMLLRSLHLEVQYEASELIKDLMRYDVQLAILKGLVSLLKPSKEDIQADKPEILSVCRSAGVMLVGEPLSLTIEQDDPTMPDFGAPLSVYVQQAAACKVIRILARQSPEVAESLVQLRVVHGLLFALGNANHPDSQRQAAITLEFFVRSFPFVNDKVKEALGETFYEEFLKNPDDLYVKLTSIQADVLSSNKINIPGDTEVQE